MSSAQFQATNTFDVFTDNSGTFSHTWKGDMQPPHKTLIGVASNTMRTVRDWYELKFSGRTGFPHTALRDSISPEILHLRVDQLYDDAQVLMRGPGHDDQESQMMEVNLQRDVYQRGSVHVDASGELTAIMVSDFAIEAVPVKDLMVQLTSMLDAESVPRIGSTVSVNSKISFPGASGPSRLTTVPLGQLLTNASQLKLDSVPITPSANGWTARVEGDWKPVLFVDGLGSRQGSERIDFILQSRDGEMALTSRSIKADHCTCA